MGVKKKITQLQEEDHQHLLMMEVLDYQMRKDPQPHNLVGQFVLVNNLFPEYQLGTPVPAQKLYAAFSIFIKAYGFEDYDKRKVFSIIKAWGIDSKRFVESGVDSKFYLVNPLNLLDKLFEDVTFEDMIDG